MVNFDVFRHYCMYGHWSYDENRIAEWTCHNKDNTPQGCSWGECNRKGCPIMGLMRDKEKENE